VASAVELWRLDQYNPPRRAARTKQAINNPRSFMAIYPN
jgi:hypothetical protein